MADEADLADLRAEAFTQESIEVARQGPFKGYQPCGQCIWCGDPVDPGRLHCRPIDNDCATDHEKWLRFNGGE